MEINYQVTELVRKYSARIKIEISTLDILETVTLEEFVQEFRNVGRVRNLDEFLQPNGLLRCFEDNELRDGMYQITNIEREDGVFNIIVLYKREGGEYFKTLKYLDDLSALENFAYFKSEEMHHSFVDFLIEKENVDSAMKYLNIVGRNTEATDLELYELRDVISDWKRANNL